MLEQTRPTYPLDPATGLHAKRAVDSVAALGELPDLLLVERSRARDSRALETLIRRYSRRLFRIARSILANDDEAEDAVRAALVRAFSNLDRYEPAGKFGSWLARLAFNEALTLRRAASARSQSGAAPASELRVGTATAPTLRAVATSSAAV